MSHLRITIRIVLLRNAIRVELLRRLILLLYYRLMLWCILILLLLLYNIRVENLSIRTKILIWIVKLFLWILIRILIWIVKLFLWILIRILVLQRNIIRILLLNLLLIYFIIILSWLIVIWIGKPAHIFKNILSFHNPLILWLMGGSLGLNWSHCRLLIWNLYNLYWLLPLLISLSLISLSSSFFLSSSFLSLFLFKFIRSISFFYRCVEDT